MDTNRTAQELTREGYQTAPATLQTKRSRGGGPAFRLYGRKPVYRWGDALAWAQSRLSEPRWSTSEHPAPRHNTEAEIIAREQRQPAAAKAAAEAAAS